MAKSTHQRNPPKNPSQRATKGTHTVNPETEERLAEAEAALRRGECKTYRQASEQFNVPYFTLQQRCRDEAAPKTKAHLNQLLLPLASEETLVDWIKFLSATGHPVNKQTIQPKVQTLMKELGRSIPDSSPSKSWIQRFLDRHPELKLGHGSGLDPKHAKAFNYLMVQSHFMLLKEHMETHNIPWENIYNMDEKGIQLGGGRRGSQQNDIPPGFVFAGSTKFPEWFTEPDTIVATSENGWTDDFVGFEWFKQGFIPKATAQNKSGTLILLIYDGHGSHTTLEWIEHACEHNIHLFCLPAHTTHRLQPLDVGVFSPLQHAWFIQCDEILEEMGNVMELRDVVAEYMKAQHTAFKSETILKAWRKAGIRPINPDIFTKADYAPSYSTSTQMHVPPLFLTKMPSVPDGSSDDGFFDPRTLAFSDPLNNDYGEENDEESDSQSSSNSDVEETEYGDDNQDEGDSTYSRERQEPSILGQSESEIPNPDHAPSQPWWLDPAIAEEYIIPAQRPELQQSAIPRPQSPAPSLAQQCNLKKSQSISASLSATSLGSHSSLDPFIESAW
ncbi:uncharacterized protein ARMOST_19055 [Armillaria ostoyae]|uniref:HTH CENPB-type domain-containing protein n=1 Tax=Armillaria ostoyae TaxID=47428 RepID=A0A284S3J9_ARMOS|nr:uncharacterized protein ARMOST_19055 [Armillaria ostoyae]